MDEIHTLLGSGSTIYLREKFVDIMRLSLVSLVHLKKKVIISSVNWAAHGAAIYI